MPDLADLIQRRKDAGRSYRMLAHDTGDLVDAPTVERWHKRQMAQFPRDAKVFVGFARALDENIEQVVLSMAAQLGVPIDRYDAAAGVLPAGAERLTFEQRRALRSLVRAIIDAQPGAGGVQEPDAAGTATFRLHTAARKRAHSETGLDGPKGRER